MVLHALLASPTCVRDIVSHVTPFRRQHLAVVYEVRPADVLSSGGHPLLTRASHVPHESLPCASRTTLLS